MAHDQGMLVRPCVFMASALSRWQNLMKAIDSAFAEKGEDRWVLSLTALYAKGIDEVDKTLKALAAKENTNFSDEFKQVCFCAVICRSFTTKSMCVLGRPRDPSRHSLCQEARRPAPAFSNPVI